MAYKLAFRGSAAATILIWVVLFVPAASATTTTPFAQAGSGIISDTECGSGVDLPASQDIQHTNGDSVSVYVEAGWNDLRPAGSLLLHSAAVKSADYGGTTYGAGHFKSLTGQEYDHADHYGPTIPGVLVGTSMTVTYFAYVYAPDVDPPGTFRCYDEGTVTYTFVA